MFFAFDGIDGTGKSTQICLFGEWLAELGHTVVTCRDPGTTRLGEALREILLQRTELAIDPIAEALIYMAARAEMVAEVIQPALASGKIVVSDRYVLANVAYQGYGLQLGAELLWRLGEIATQQILPDMTFVLDLEVEQAAQRRGIARDRLEQRTVDFHNRVRQGFLAEAAKHPDSILVIPAQNSPEAIHLLIREKSQSLLPNRSFTPRP